MPLDFSLTPEQEEVRRLAHQFAVREMRPRAAHYDECEETPWEVMHKAHVLGLDASAAFSKEYGGGGADFITELILTEELSWGDAGIAVSIQGTGLCGAAIVALGTEAQKKRYVGMLADPETLRIGAMGLTEPNSGSDALALETTARRVDGGWVVDGTKQFCTNGGVADLQVVFATTDRSLGPAAIAGFVVEKGNPGMRQGRKEKKMGVRASHTAQVILEDCFVAEEAQLGARGGRRRRGRARSGRSGARGHPSPGRRRCPRDRPGGLRVRPRLLPRAPRLRQADRPPQAIAFKLADMATEINAARLLIWRAGWMIAQGIPWPGARGRWPSSTPATWRCGSPPRPSRCWAGTATSRSTRWSASCATPRSTRSGRGPPRSSGLVISRCLLGERPPLARPAPAGRGPTVPRSAPG